MNAQLKAAIPVLFSIGALVTGCEAGDNAGGEAIQPIQEEEAGEEELADYTPSVEATVAAEEAESLVETEELGETIPTESTTEDDSTVSGDDTLDLDDEVTESETDEEEATNTEDELFEEAEEETQTDMESDDSMEVAFMPLNDTGEVVSYVEIDRYMGQWFEIATTPSFQQLACFGTTADYTFNEEKGWVDVTNTCYSGSLSGNAQKISGKAEVDDTETQAKLLVFFFNQGSPYWVVALDGTEGTAPYDWAVVSVPGGKTMWLLSRTPQMDPALRESIEAHLEERGFPVDTLIDTPQPE